MKKLLLISTLDDVQDLFSKIKNMSPDKIIMSTAVLDTESLEYSNFMSMLEIDYPDLVVEEYDISHWTY